MLLLKTTGHFSFSVGEKAGMREGKNTNIRNRIFINIMT
jgi:hypothetical protein